MKLKERVAIVTGGTGKLGPEMIRSLIEEGARVASFSLSGDVTKSKKLTNFLASYPLALSIHRVDITKEEDVKRGVDEVITKFGTTPTVLINNAGLDVPPNASIEDCGPFETYPLRAWRALIDSHLTGSFLMSREVVGRMIKEKLGGSIINIGSTYGLGAPRQEIYDWRRKKGENFFKPVSYSTAKAGMVGFTKWLAGYCGPHSIRVNCLAMGGVYHGQGKEFDDAYSKHTMLGRMGKDGEYNAAIIFLASEDSSYMTGSVLSIDGGWTAW